MNGPRYSLSNQHGQLSESELRRLAEHSERLERFEVGGPCSYIDTGAGRVIIPQTQQASTATEFSGCQLILAFGEITIPSNQTTVIPWRSVNGQNSYQFGGNYHSNSNPTKILIPAPGLYLIECQVAFSNGPQGNLGSRNLGLRPNGSPLPFNVFEPGLHASQAQTLWMSQALRISLDYLEIGVQQSSGINQRIVAVSNSWNIFARVTRLRLT